ncbi:hypothetical protein BC829DRAFT_455329 [Chytridium lagenaria]|nr:hypothetical protein BC829DRAFT_455329 [Chytridium lagenaria]
MLESKPRNLFEVLSLGTADVVLDAKNLGTAAFELWHAEDVAAGADSLDNDAQVAFSVDGTGPWWLLPHSIHAEKLSMPFSDNLSALIHICIADQTVLLHLSNMSKCLLSEIMRSSGKRMQPTLIQSLIHGQRKLHGDSYVARAKLCTMPNPWFIYPPWSVYKVYQTITSLITFQAPSFDSGKIKHESHAHRTAAAISNTNFRPTPKSRGRKSSYGDDAIPHTSQKKCTNCGTSTTPMWRKGPMGAASLCNACGVKWRQGKLLVGANSSLANASQDPQDRL